MAVQKENLLVNEIAGAGGNKFEYCMQFGGMDCKHEFCLVFAFELFSVASRCTEMPIKISAPCTSVWLGHLQRSNVL